MGKTKSNPRYHVISCRVSAAEREEIHAEVGSNVLSAFVLQAVKDKIRRDRERRMRDAVPSGV